MVESDSKSSDGGVAVSIELISRGEGNIFISISEVINRALFSRITCAL